MSVRTAQQAYGTATTQMRQARQEQEGQALDRVLADSLREYGQPDTVAQPPSFAPPAPAAAPAPKALPAGAPTVPAEEKGIQAPEAMPRPTPAATPGFNPAAPSPAAPQPDLRKRMVGNLARSGVPGSGKAAFSLYGQAQAQDDQIERAALTAIVKGDDVTYDYFVRKMGKNLLPPEVLQDARSKKVAAAAMLNAEKLYRNSPQQAHAFVQSYIQNGGDLSAALQQTGAPAGYDMTRGNRPQSFIGPDGQEFAGIMVAGPDGSIVVQPVQGPNGGNVRLAPTGRARGTGGGAGAGAGGKAMNYQQARTRAYAELKGSSADPTKITEQQIDQRARQIMQLSTGAPPAEAAPAAAAPAASSPPAAPQAAPPASRFNFRGVPLFGGGAPAAPDPASLLLGGEGGAPPAPMPRPGTFDAAPPAPMPRPGQTASAGAPPPAGTRHRVFDRSRNAFVDVGG